MPKELITPPDDALQSTLGELRKIVQTADRIGAPDESADGGTVHADGGTVRGSRLRTLTVVHPGASGE